MFAGFRAAIFGGVGASGGNAESGGTELAPLVGKSGAVSAEAAGNEITAPSLARATGSRYSSAAGGDDPDSKTSIWLTALNIMNGVLGAGILGLPAAVAESGTSK